MVHGCLFAAHADFDCPFVESAPGIPVAVKAWIGRVDLLAVEVTGRGGVVGDGPGDVAVEAPPEAGYARVAGAGRVVVRSVEGVFVPARRQPEGLVGIAAQQRVTGRRV